VPSPGELVAAWRRLGPRRFAAAALRALVAVVRPHARRARIRYAPPRAPRHAVARALDGDPFAAVRAAMPTVVAWEAELEADRDSILARADAVAAHRFDLLGSGPVDLGPEIPWRRDFKTGAEWPLHHISRVPIVLGGGSDIKVPWELSRAQHLPLLAAAHRLTGDPRYRDELGAQLHSWITANPVERGPNWACTMDVAIRAANWLAALALLEERPPWLDRVVGSLLLHGRFIRANLEWGEVRGNHYLSDVVGLLPVAALFNGSREGRAWVTWAARELEREMAHQVRPDGCDHEMSIPYHRLVCELFVCGAQHAEALAPGALSTAFHERLVLMLRFAADHERPDGLSPQAGDADSGRYLPLGEYGRDQRDHRHLFAQAGVATPGARCHADYPDGGWYVMRHEDLWAMVRCGDVGLEGVGAHAHNDQLSFELCLGGQPLVVDPGSYLYTADPVARNAFRATSAHATLQVDGREQNPLRSDYLFAVEDRAQARGLSWEAEGPRATFVGEHRGFAPIVHRRRVAFDGEARTVEIEDQVTGGEQLQWSFPLAPGAHVTIDGARATARWPAAALTFEAPDGVTWALGDGWVSPAYGIRERAPVLRAHSGARPHTRIALTIS
jgi:heparinase II/III-like protein